MTSNPLWNQNRCFCRPPETNYDTRVRQENEKVRYEIQVLQKEMERMTLGEQESAKMTLMGRSVTA